MSRMHVCESKAKTINIGNLEALCPLRAGRKTA